MKEIISMRGVDEVLHFTTNEGLVGILDSNRLKSRARLDSDKRLEFILKKNTPKVLDPCWVDYVNLSISKINSVLYNISSTYWHRDVAWRILSFDSSILEHGGVLFVTTNNAYPSALRGEGEVAFERLFASVVVGRYASKTHRDINISPKETTDPQAEVLYPGEISTSFLNKIYVPSDEDADEVCGQIAALGHPQVEVTVSPRKFEGVLK